MKKLLLFLCFMGFLIISVPAGAVEDANDLWDVRQGNVVTGLVTSGVWSGGYGSLQSDIRNMFGGSFGNLEANRTIFYDADIIGPGYNNWVTWETPTEISLKRFTLDLGSDGATSTSNRAARTFNLYSGLYDSQLNAISWTRIYTTGQDPITYIPAGVNWYEYSIDVTFGNTIQSKYFKADFIQESYTTGARVIELNGYGTTPVPIPGAILLFAPGLAGLALLRRRFKK